jgi:hypothetical protein
MKAKKDKPDQVVDSPEAMSYPTNVGAPAFTIPAVLSHKQDRGINATNLLQTKFDELKEEYFRLVQLAEDTELVYQATYNFIPKVGGTYHLYSDTNDKLFLSMIEPEKWTHMSHYGSFKFTSDNTWERQ